MSAGTLLLVAGSRSLGRDARAYPGAVVLAGAEGPDVWAEDLALLFGHRVVVYRPAHGPEHALEVHAFCSGPAPRVVHRSACLVEVETPQRLDWVCGVCCTLDVARYPTPERDRAVSLQRHERCLARFAARIDTQNLEGAA